MSAELFFKLFLFSCWTLTYLLIIRRAYLDKVPGMPFLATCLNTTWEAMMLTQHELLGIGWWTVFAWFALDCVILVQYFIYGRPRVVRSLRERLFWPSTIAILLVGIGTPIALTVRFEDYDGLIAAYFQNALMSILFCTMLIERNSIRGQSIYIALAKFLGTSVVVTYGEPSDPFLIWCYAVIMLFDVAYIGLVHHVGRRDGVRVLLRL